MKRIIVIGCPGAGKSTFSQNLSSILKIPVYHLDLLWHKEDKTTISRDDFDVILEEILVRSNYIMDGNYQRTLEMRLKASDTVFLLDYTTEICLSGANERVGKERTDLPWIEEKVSEDFKQKILAFSNDNLPKIYDLLSKYRDNKNIIIFKNRDEADAYLEELQNSDIVKSA